MGTSHSVDHLTSLSSYLSSLVPFHPWYFFTKFSKMSCTYSNKVVSVQHHEWVHALCATMMRYTDKQYSCCMTRHILHTVGCFSEMCYWNGDSQFWVSKLGIFGGPRWASKNWRQLGLVPLKNVCICLLRCLAPFTYLWKKDKGIVTGKVIAKMFKENSSSEKNKYLKLTLLTSVGVSCTQQKLEEYPSIHWRNRQIKTFLINV